MAVRSSLRWSTPSRRLAKSNLAGSQPPGVRRCQATGAVWTRIDPSRSNSSREAQSLASCGRWRTSATRSTRSPESRRSSAEDDSTSAGTHSHDRFSCAGIQTEDHAGERGCSSTTLPAGRSTMLNWRRQPRATTSKAIRSSSTPVRGGSRKSTCGPGRASQPGTSRHPR